MPFTEGALVSSIVDEAGKDELTNQLMAQELELDEDNNVPTNPIFWSAGSIVVTVLNCAQKVITPVLCISSHLGNRFGLTLGANPRAVINKQEDLIPNAVTFAKNAGTVANHNKDYISTVLLTQKQMMKVVPIRPDQVNYSSAAAAVHLAYELSPKSSKY
jgi:hypothetical protein